MNVLPKSALTDDVLLVNCWYSVLWEVNVRGKSICINIYESPKIALCGGIVIVTFAPSHDHCTLLLLSVA